MITYLLETNICVYILKQKPFNVFQKFTSIDSYSIAVSSITVAELMYGVHKSNSKDRNLLAVNELLNSVQILDFDHNAASHFGTLKNSLLKKGTPIGPLDMLIAAHAISLNVVLVSNNLKEFNRVEGLLTENWV